MKLVYKLYMVEKVLVFFWKLGAQGAMFISLANFYLKNMIWTCAKDFSWKMVKIHQNLKNHDST
jgi:hypothetical protein